MSEAERQIVVAARLEQGERAFQMIACFAVFSGEPMRDPGRAVRDSGFGRVAIAVGVSEKGLDVGPHRQQLAASVAATPKTVVSRQTLKPGVAARCRLARFGEGLSCLGRAVAARGDQGVAVDDLQLLSLA